MQWPQYAELQVNGMPAIFCKLDLCIQIRMFAYVRLQLKHTCSVLDSYFMKNKGLSNISVIFSSFFAGYPVRVVARPGSQLLGINGRDDGPVVS
jgi:hypothetical protein